jgi:hypothetical protein
MIKLSHAFDEAYARWCGAPQEIGPAKSPVVASVDDFDRAFAEWEDVAFDQLVDQMGDDFDDAPTAVYGTTARCHA